jgi:hypothetical protein
MRPAPIGGFRPPSGLKVKTLEDAERSRLEHDRAIRELQQAPSASTHFIPNIALANGVTTTIPHGLGRAPNFVCESIPRGAVSAGYIIEIRGAVDRTQSIQLQANGWGATITVDLVVA